MGRVERIDMDALLVLILAQTINYTVTVASSIDPLVITIYLKSFNLKNQEQKIFAVFR